MKIGIISDTHDNLKSVQKAFEIFKENNVGLIVHCGDWVSPFTFKFFIEQMQNTNIPAKGIYGNNIGDKERIEKVLAESVKIPLEIFPDKAIEVEIEGKKIAICHGDDAAMLATLTTSEKYDVVFTGHTHKVRNEKVNNVLILNPGSICFAVDSKITDSASVAIYDTQTNSATITYFSISPK